MTKTFADMTPEERADCVGMWCDIETPMGTETVIYDQSRWTKGPTLFEPEFGHFDVDLSDITPRFDLPRAWMPDDKPVSGEWEYAVQYLTPDGWKYSRESWDCRWQESEAVQEVRAYRDHPGQETRIVRRLVGDPEVMEP